MLQHSSNQAVQESEKNIVCLADNLTVYVLKSRGFQSFFDFPSSRDLYF